jgi:hypothetical protein
MQLTLGGYALTQSNAPTDADRSHSCAASPARLEDFQFNVCSRVMNWMSFEAGNAERRPAETTQRYDI